MIYSFSVVKRELYYNCELCPNRCRTDRSKRKGLCGEGDQVRIAWSGLHRGEEPPITGESGSGMIFFCGCPLHCPYCQNHQISGYDESVGIEVDEEELAALMLSLEEQGAHTLNLVTGTHFIPSIISSLEIAKAKGFTLPVVWNSSGYETAEAIRMIDPYIDLYLVDVKSLDEGVCKRFCGGEKYAKAVLPAIETILSLRPYTDLDELEGTLVRHLVFPGCVKQTLGFLEWFSRSCKKQCLLSLMVQFIPPLGDVTFPPITDDEYDMLLDALDFYGIDGFVQERSDDDILWIPDFRKDVPFPSSFADANGYFLSLKNANR